LAFAVVCICFALLGGFCLNKNDQLSTFFFNSPHGACQCCYHYYYFLVVPQRVDWNSHLMTSAKTHT